MLRPVRILRRDFSRHWVLSARARAIGRALRRAVEAPERLPAPLFALLLGLLAYAGARARWPWALGLWSFMVGDWVLITLLPRFGKSYGPRQSGTFVLA